MYPTFTGRAAALTIAGLALMILIALYHHPVAGRHVGAHELHAQIVQLEGRDQLVHGALTAMLAVMACALSVFSGALGKRRPAARLGWSAYCLGSVLLGVAMLFDGFIIPQLAGLFLAAGPLQAEAGLAVMRACSVVIQVFSKAGLLAHSIAMLAWSCAAIRRGQGLQGKRLCKALGIAAAVLPAVLMLCTEVTLTRQTLLLMFTAQAVWYLLAACLLYYKLRTAS